MGTPLDVDVSQRTLKGLFSKPRRRKVEIEMADFQEAQRDQEVKKFLQEARAQGEKLKRDGLIHP